MKKQKTWEPLKKGDVVDVIASGFSTTPEALEGAKKFLINLDLTPRVPQDLYGADIICSNTDEVRFKHLKHALLAKDSRAIWCLRGGYGALRLIDKLAKLKPPKQPKQPKLFIGYSDSTTIHNYLNQFWHWPTMHGPLLDRLGGLARVDEQVTELTDLIFGRQRRVIFKNLSPLNAAAAKKNKKITASIVGGNLAVTQTHLGTRYARQPKGQILFFEDVGERGYRVDKMLKHLELAGYLLGVKAIIFGEFIRGEEPGPNSASRVPDVLKRFADEQKIPVFSGIEVGHGDQQRPLPLGTTAELNCGSKPLLIVSSGANHERI